jgi:hypothetical protein
LTLADEVLSSPSTSGSIELSLPAPAQLTARSGLPKHLII